MFTPGTAKLFGLKTSIVPVTFQSWFVLLAGFALTV
jgi:biotin transporter BioY